MPSSHHVHVTLQVTPATSPCPTLSTDGWPTCKHMETIISAQCAVWCNQKCTITSFVELAWFHAVKMSRMCSKVGLLNFWEKNSLFAAKHFLLGLIYYIAHARNVYKSWINLGSSTGVKSKLLEKHIRDILLAHFEEHHPISTQQWGFTCGRSTTGALLDAIDQWFRQLEQGHDICTVFLTTVKLLIQFHTGLYCKSFKIMVYTNRSSDGLHITYLCSRTQYVCVNGSSSDILPVSLALYADDIMLYRPIYTPADFSLLQQDIDDICIWTTNNVLKFNSNI